MNCINWLPAKFRCNFYVPSLRQSLPSYLSASLCTHQTVHSHLTFQLRSAPIRQYTSILPFSFALHPSDSTLPSYLSASLCTYQTVHSHLTFQLRSARIKHHAPSHPQARSFWKFRNVIWNLSVSSLSVLSLHLSGILCLPVCEIFPLCLGSKPSSRLNFLFIQAFLQT